MKELKRVHPLSKEEDDQLTKGYKEGEKHHFRLRCQGILLSNQGLSVPEIAFRLNKKKDTIYAWLRKYEMYGIQGLENQAGQGLKARLDLLDKEQIKIVKDAVDDEPQNLNKVSTFLSEKLGFPITKWMLIRFLKKKFNYTWRRIRKWLKPSQNPLEYQMKIIHLCGLLWLEKQGFISVYYGDEAGFSMNSYLPSAWQKKGEPIAIVPNKSARINVFGLMSRDMDFHPYTTKGAMTADLTIAFINDFAKNITAPTAIILDNATIHHSEEFHEQIELWEEQDLFIFYLPKYAPHLNLIETLWRKIKYEWLQQHHYSGSDFFFASLEAILLNIGITYNINFKDQLVPV